MNVNEAIKILNAVDNEQKARDRIGEVLATARDAALAVKGFDRRAAELRKDIADLQIDLESLAVDYEQKETVAKASLVTIKTEAADAKALFDVESKAALSALGADKSRLTRSIDGLQSKHDAKVSQLETETAEYVKKRDEAQKAYEDIQDRIARYAR